VPLQSQYGYVTYFLGVKNAMEMCRHVTWYNDLGTAKILKKFYKVGEGAALILKSFCSTVSHKKCLSAAATLLVCRIMGAWR
jgi:hypothetical protein